MTSPPLGFWPDSKNWLPITNPSSGLEGIFASLVGGNNFTGNQYITGDLRATTLTALGPITATAGALSAAFTPEEGNNRLWIDVSGLGHSSDSILLGDALSPDNAVLNLRGISIGALTLPTSKLDITQSSNTAPTALFLSTANSATIGPYLTLKRNKGVVAVVNDVIGGIYFEGNNSTVGGNNTYALIRTQIITPTTGTESAQVQFFVDGGGTLSQRAYIGLGLVLGAPTGGDKGMGTLNATALYLNGAPLDTAATVPTGTSGHTIPYLDGVNTWSAVQSITIPAAGQSALRVISTDSGATTGPYLIIHRDSTTPAGADVLGELRFDGNDSLGNETALAGARAVFMNPVDGSEQARLELLSTQLGSYGPRVSVGLGLYTVSVADMGSNTINATTLYEAGTSLTSKYARLGVANIFTTDQEIRGTLSITAGAQNVTIAPDEAGGRMIIDVSGTGHSGDYILLGDVSGLNNTYIAGNASIGAIAVPGSKLDVTQTTTATPTAIFINTSNSASSGPHVVLDRNKGGTNIGGVANDVLGVIRFRGRSSTGVSRDFANFYSSILTATNAAEASQLVFQTYVTGTLTTTAYLRGGFVVGVPTGGDKGLNTINTTAFYENGTPLGSIYAELSGANFTGSVVSALNVITTGGYMHVDRGGDAATAVMYISSDPGWGGQIQFRTGTSLRWLLYKNTTPEAAGDIGSDFQILRYDNNAGPLGSVMTITRSTGNTSFSGSVTALGALTATAGGLYVDRRGDGAGAYMYMYADVNQFTQITFYGGSTARWALFKNITAETGGTTGNGGADLELRAYNNDGSSHGTPLSINRSSCVVNFLYPPSIASVPIDSIYSSYVDTGVSLSGLSNIPTYTPPTSLPEIHVRGGSGFGFWDYIGTTLSNANWPTSTDTTGRIYSRTEVTSTRGPKIWDFLWWSPTSSSTIDQTALLRKAIDCYDPTGDPVVLRLPAGYTIRVEESIRVTGKHRMTIEGPRTAVILKGISSAATNYYPFFGADTTGNGLEDFTLRGFTMDGGGFAEPSDDYPCVMFYKCMNLEISNMTFRNGNVGARVGMSNYTNNRVRIFNNYIYNMACHAIEIWYCDDSYIEHNVCEPGLLTGTSAGDPSSRAIRCLWSKHVNISKNQIIQTATSAWKAGIVLNSGNYDINITDNYFDGCSGADGALWQYGIAEQINITGNVFRGEAAQSVKFIFFGEASSESANRSNNVIIANNMFQANGTETHLIHLRYCDGFDIHGNTFKHVNSMSTPVFYGILVESSNGNGMIHSNRFHMNGSATNQRPIRLQVLTSAARIGVINNYYNTSASTFVGVTDGTGVCVLTPNYAYA